jgi:hypothetical protein
MKEEDEIKGEDGGIKEERSIKNKRRRWLVLLQS